MLRGNVDLSRIPVDRLIYVLSVYYPEVMLAEIAEYQEGTLHVPCNDQTLKVFDLNKS